MRKAVSFLLALALLAALVLPAAAANERRIALVIGNGSYKSAPLRNPLNDARDMAELLRRLDFEVTLLENAGQKAMEEAVRAFGAKLGRGRVGLFYYAGHGLQVDGANYLIPTDAAIGAKSELKYEAVDAGRVLDIMEEAHSELNVIILDACRDNPFSRGVRGLSGGLAEMNAPAGSIIGYATSPGKTAADGSGKNGVYTKHLLANLPTPGIPINEVFMRTRIGVSRETGEKQIPWDSSTLTRYFYLAGEGPAAPQPEARKDLADVEAQKKALEEQKSALAERQQALARERSRLESERKALEQVLAGQPKQARTDEERQALQAERERLRVEHQALDGEKARLAAQQQALEAQWEAERRRAESGSPAAPKPKQAEARPGPRGWIGLTIQEVTPEAARSVGLSEPKGALVAKVYEHDPAALAGVRPWDVVLDINGQPVRNGRDMIQIIFALGPGDEARLTLWRRGQVVVRSVVLGESRR
jgi:uncharacterized caspase-like protein